MEAAKEKNRTIHVILAEHAGFCFGVKRALEKAEEAVHSSEKPVYTYGELIHNETVVSDLEQQGVHMLPEGTDPADIPKGTVIIRSHGVSEQISQSLANAGLTVIDATCPFVQKIHRLVREYSGKGYHILITGDRNHAEVQGIMGWVPNGDVLAVSTREEIDALPWQAGEKVCIVSQTTFDYLKFEEFVEIIGRKGYDVICLNTICSATEERQKAARDIADKVDVMIVIGGKHSSNSKKLAELCRKENPNTFFIQSAGDLDLSVLESIDSVGITAGASTPDKIIEEVFLTCQQKKALRRC